MKPFAWGSRPCYQGQKMTTDPQEPAAPSEFTLLLEASRNGSEQAWSSLMRVVYADLRRLAQRHRYQVGPGGSLNTTGLLHESYFRLAGSVRQTVASRAHFFALASRIMRQVMCDYARERLAAKRGGGLPTKQLHEIDAAEQSEAESLVQIDKALKALEAKEAIWARIVECRFFAGLSEEETAEALGLSVRTTQRKWSYAREWLAVYLGDAQSTGDPLPSNPGRRDVTPE